MVPIGKSYILGWGELIITISFPSHLHQAHGPIVAPSGSVFTSLNVGQGGEQIAAYWTQNPKNNTATQAFIMIHGRMRDGDAVSGRGCSDWTHCILILDTKSTFFQPLFSTGLR